MKKTLIALMALAGLATAADPELVWELDFTADAVRQYNYTGALTLPSSTTGTLDGAAGTLTLNNQKYGFTQKSGALTFGDEFTMIVKLSMASYGDYPVLFSLGADHGNCLKAGYYFKSGDTLANRFVLDVDGVASDQPSTKASGNISYTLPGTAGAYGDAVTLALYNDGAGNVTYYVDGASAGSITLNDEALSTGVASFSLGGRIGDGNTSNVTLYEVQFAKGFATSVIPEPATATLSLLALAGLAARRRRR